MTIRDILGIKEPKVWKSKQTPVACAMADLIVGVEIETENCLHGDEWYAERLPKLWEVKGDGSLRGRAWEFISKPSPIGTLIPELEDFYRVTGFGERNYTDRCSIHVHTNITDLTTQQVAALSLVYSVVEEVLFDFVNWYKSPTKWGYSRDTNIYCVPWNQCRMNSEMVQRMFTDVDYAVRHWHKYTALNILPARSIGTVEWRHMHGTADMDKFTKWLNLIGSIVKYAKAKTFDEVMTIIKGLNDTSAYRQFYYEVLGGYIPFSDDVQQKIIVGVVNAKTSLLGLTDTTPRAPKKVKLREVDEAPIRRTLNNVQEVLQTHANREDRFRALERDLLARGEYPLERVQVRTPGGLYSWGVSTNGGAIYNSNGEVTPLEAEVRRIDPEPRYVAGFGTQFFTVDRAYRPTQVGAPMFVALDEVTEEEDM